MTTEPERTKQNGDFEETLTRLDSKDFDGHSDFSALTPEQKLAWLSNIARFLYEIRQPQKP
jgi:hypothetical protein